MYNNYMGNTYMPGMMQNPYQTRLDALQQPQMQPMQQPMQRYDIIHVNGENGAKSFRMAPNSQCLLLDDTAPIVWLCQSDGAGYHTVTPYQIAPYQAQPEPDYNAFNQRLTRLEEKFNEQSHVADAKPAKRTGKPADAE